jgi:hypothetical protein
MRRFKRNNTNFLIGEIETMRTFLAFCLLNRPYMIASAKDFYAYIPSENISMETVTDLIMALGFENVIQSLFFWKPEKALLLYEETVVINASNRFSNAREAVSYMTKKVALVLTPML